MFKPHQQTLYLPEIGIRVRTATVIAPAHKCDVFPVKPEFIASRCPGTEGHYL